MYNGIIHAGSIIHVYNELYKLMCIIHVYYTMYNLAVCSGDGAIHDLHIPKHASSEAVWRHGLGKHHTTCEGPSNEAGD